MYSICNVIVGVPITYELSNLIDTWEREEDSRWKEWSDLGFDVFYHGGCDQHVGFCGIMLGEFDECGDTIRVNSFTTLRYQLSNDVKFIPLVPTAQQLDDAEKKVANLDPDIRKICPSVGVYFIFSSS